MIQYISEFNLPKEYSKKKKFELLTGILIPNGQWKDADIKWPINYDLQRMYLTIEECVKAVILNSIKNDPIKELFNNDYVAISVFTFPTIYLNDVPLARDIMDNAIDCNWDESTLSFDFTLRKMKTSQSSSFEYGWEDLHISTVKIDSYDAVPDEQGNLKITNLKIYPVLDFTSF